MHIVVSREVFSDGSSEAYCYTVDTGYQLETLKQEIRDEGRKILDFDDRFHVMVTQDMVRRF